MRIVFLGASRFGLRCLRAIERLPGCELAGVVTGPREFAISYRPQGVTNVLHADFSAHCAEMRIPCMELGPAAMKDEALLQAVRGWRPDAFVVAGWYHIVPKTWRSVAPTYGLHASLLPQYRGGAPLVWAILRGEKRAGITMFEFDDGVDTGPIVGQSATPIEEADTIATLYARIEVLGEQLLVDALPRLADGTLQPAPQSQDGASIFPQRGPEDGRIDWTWDARRIYDFVRAQTKPYPGAFFDRAGRRITVWSSRCIEPSSRLAPGVLISDEGRVLIGCGGSTALQLLDIAVDGRDVPVSPWMGDEA